MVSGRADTRPIQQRLKIDLNDHVVSIAPNVARITWPRPTAIGVVTKSTVSLLEHHASHLSAEAFGIDENNVFGFWDWVTLHFAVSTAQGSRIDKGQQVRR